jgi:ribA/ribD-fused uncharacterized protein
MNHRLDTDDTVYFYETDFYALSNFSAFRLRWKGLDFDTSEAAYQWEKFPQSPVLQEAILHAPSAHEAFTLAVDERSRQRDDWDEVRVEIMRAILQAKVEQHPYVKRKLLDTGARTLIEDSWRDTFWGIGRDGHGENMLGCLWMEIRGDVFHEELAAGRRPWEHQPPPPTGRLPHA